MEFFPPTQLLGKQGNRLSRQVKGFFFAKNRLVPRGLVAGADKRLVSGHGYWLTFKNK